MLTKRSPDATALGRRPVRVAAPRITRPEDPRLLPSLRTGRFRWPSARRITLLRKVGAGTGVSIGAGVGVLGAECHPDGRAAAHAARTLVDVPRGHRCRSTCSRSSIEVPLCASHSSSTSPTSASPCSARWRSRRCSPTPHRFDRVRSAFTLVLFGGLLAPALTSILMATAFVLFGISDEMWLTMVARTVTNTFAVVTLVPLIVHCAERLRSGQRPISVKRAAEAHDAGARPTLAVCVLLFFIPIDSPKRTPAAAVRAAAAGGVGRDAFRCRRRLRRLPDGRRACRCWPWSTAMVR